jgi:hypothetical protein
MRSVDTSADRPAPLAVRVVELTRRQLLVLGLLACVPLPLLSIGTAVVPLPEIIQRAAASLVPFAPATAHMPVRAEPQSSATQRRTAAKVSTSAADDSRPSSPSKPKGAIAGARAFSVPKHPTSAAPTVAVAPTRSSGDTTVGESGPTQPTTPPTPDQTAPVQDPAPPLSGGDEKKGKDNGKAGDKAATGASGTETGNGGKPDKSAGPSTAPPTGGGSGQKTGQDGSGGKAGDKTKP